MHARALAVISILGWFWQAKRTQNNYYANETQYGCLKFFNESACVVTRQYVHGDSHRDLGILCEAGCFHPVLAGLVMLLRYAPRLEAFWTQMVGRPKNREKAIHTLESAAQTLENLFSGVVESENEGKSPELERIGRLPVSRVVNELRFYTRLVNSARSISAETETRSPAELAKYLLSSYVRSLTGRFHDRSVSGLVGEVSGLPEYDEVAHRMWRARNYERIDQHFSWMTRLLVTMSIVIAKTP